MGSPRSFHTFFAVAVSFLVVPALLGSASGASAQDVAPPAHLGVVDGAASIEREGETDPATLGMTLVAGDRLTTTNGRVEILFPDGSGVDVDEYSSVDLESPSLLRLTGGRVLLFVARPRDPAATPQFQIDTPVASATSEGPGEYRLTLMSDPAGLEAELSVVRGSAALATERGSMLLRAGERSRARDNEPPSFPQIFNSARFDTFDSWTDARRNERLGAAQSAQYLPADLRMYGGTFDRYGAWQYEAPYGYVWYPAVAPGWRPYYNGYWTSVPAFGWTWVGLDVWAWPTHHYGRWGYGRDRWFWIPASHWGPAWVTWASAPGYVSWCPLGFDNRPVFALSVNVGNPWAGWVVLPRTEFGVHRANVRRYAVVDQHFSARMPFITQASAPVPVPVGHAVPRGQFQQPAVGRRQSTVDSPQPAVGRRQSAVESGVGRRQPAVDSPQPGVGRLQPAVGRQNLYRRQAPVAGDPGAPNAGRQLPTADRRLSTVDRGLPSSTARQPFPETFRGYRRGPDPTAARPVGIPGAVGVPAPVGIPGSVGMPSPVGIAAPVMIDRRHDPPTATPPAQTEQPPQFRRAAPRGEAQQPSAPPPQTAARQSGPAQPDSAPPRGHDGQSVGRATRR